MRNKPQNLNLNEHKKDKKKRKENEFYMGQKELSEL